MGSIIKYFTNSEIHYENAINYYILLIMISIMVLFETITNIQEYNFFNFFIIIISIIILFYIEYNIQLTYKNPINEITEGLKLRILFIHILFICLYFLYLIVLINNIIIFWG